jgi:hypothetical protein
MKKPEFPKPRLIREDFLPEQDPLINYRIKKVTKPDGKVRYYPQKKFLWFWIDICETFGDCYYTEWAAQTLIFADYHKTQKDKIEYLLADYYKTQKDKIEYLPADSSKTVRPEPNHPPNPV